MKNRLHTLDTLKKDSQKGYRESREIRGAVVFLLLGGEMGKTSHTEHNIKTAHTHTQGNDKQITEKGSLFFCRAKRCLTHNEQKEMKYITKRDLCP